MCCRRLNLDTVRSCLNYVFLKYPTYVSFVWMCWECYDVPGFAMDGPPSGCREQDGLNRHLAIPQFMELLDRRGIVFTELAAARDFREAALESAGALPADGPWRDFFNKSKALCGAHRGGWTSDAREGVRVGVGAEVGVDVIHWAGRAGGGGRRAAPNSGKLGPMLANVGQMLATCRQNWSTPCSCCPPSAHHTLALPFADSRPAFRVSATCGARRG